MEHHIRTLGTVNLRKGPGTNYPVIKNLPKDTVLHVLEVIAGLTWYRARTESGQEGYITSLSKYVENYNPEWKVKAAEAIRIAESYLGTPYLFGSTRFNDKTFDCSDLVQFCIYKATGVKIGSDSRAQSKDGIGIGTGFDVLRTGDLIFFDTNNDGVINHVAFYVYPNKLLHTYSTTSNVYNEDNKLIEKGTGGVTYSPYTEGSYWRNKTTGARRVIL